MRAGTVALTVLSTIAALAGEGAVARATSSSPANARGVAALVAAKSAHQPVYVVKQTITHSARARTTTAYVNTRRRIVVVLAGRKTDVIYARGLFAQNEALVKGGRRCWLEVSESFASVMATGWAPWPLTAPSQSSATTPYRVKGDLLSWSDRTGRGQIDFNNHDLITGAQTYRHDSRTPIDTVSVRYPEALPASVPRNVPTTDVCRASGP